MQLSRDQINSLGERAISRQARALSTKIDRRLGLEKSSSASDRVSCLASIVVDEEKTEYVRSAFPEVELGFLTKLLCQALAKGWTYDEQAVAALMYAAPLLGALWFLDARWVEQNDIQQCDLGDAASLVDFACSRLGLPFQQAWQRRRELKASLLHCAAHELKEDFSKDALQFVTSVVFKNADIEADAKDISDFLKRVRQTIDPLVVSDRHLQSACIAGDLIYGIGRSSRILAAIPKEGNLFTQIETIRKAIETHGRF
jgi:hypothetical protein